MVGTNHTITRHNINRAFKEITVINQFVLAVCKLQFYCSSWNTKENKILAGCTSDSGWTYLKFGWIHTPINFTFFLPLGHHMMPLAMGFYNVSKTSHIILFKFFLFLFSSCTTNCPQVCFWFPRQLFMSQLLETVQSTNTSAGKGSMIGFIKTTYNWTLLSLVLNFKSSRSLLHKWKKYVPHVRKARDKRTKSGT